MSYPLDHKGEALLGVEPNIKALQALLAPCLRAVAGARLALASKAYEALMGLLHYPAHLV
jgi:hypothetical protein